MCTYTTLGLILFNTLPILISLIIAAVIVVFMIKRLKFNLIWKIVLITFVLILWYFISSLISFYVVDKISHSSFFEKQKIQIWQCDNSLRSGMLQPPSDLQVGYVYNGLRLPVQLDETEVTNSLMDKKNIEIKKNICSQTISMAKEDGWQVLDTDVFTDGGSTTYSLFKNKDVPAADIYCKYDMMSGKFSSTTISFIHPAYVGSWLLKMNSHPAREFGTKPLIKVEELMGCDGKIIQGAYDGTVECYKGSKVID
jgi:hypothetical protein